ncbi:YdeI/OmpD-associated family protein [Aeromicrobium sp.]|nr:YdeI/OmpD-associated family protein [Candidatus Saccharibacteria bacterium]
MLTRQIAGGVEHTLPADMRKAIHANKSLCNMWEDLTPLARNEWVCWVITVAKPETRAKHIIVMQDKMLRSGMRRPCCWVGCMHRAGKKPFVRVLKPKKIDS